MKIKTSEATGLQLDWGLALALKKRVRYCSIYKAFVFDDCEDNLYIFSHADPAVCMGLIKDMLIYGVSLSDFSSVDEGTVEFCCEVNFKHFSGDTIEQAVARCVIAMRLGDEFEVPDELEVVV